MEHYVIGHDWAVELLQRQYEAGRVPQSLLITGPPNVGKSTLARYFAQSLTCHGPAKPCGDCLSCRKFASGNHPDIRIFDEEGEALKIDQVRALQHDLSLSPYESEYRVALLCNFERATTSAANALLKTLEEPASYTVLVLTAIDPDRLLPTIVSRCQGIALRPVPVPLMLDALQPQTDPARAELLSQLSAGRLGWALRAIADDSFLERRAQHFETWQAILQASRAERLSYAQGLSRDADLMREVLSLWLTLWRDLLLLRSGSQTKITNLDWQEPLAQLATRFEVAQSRAMLARLRQALTNLDYNVNSRLNLEVVLLRTPGY